MQINPYSCVWYSIFPCYFHFISSWGWIKNKWPPYIARALSGPARCRQLLVVCSLTTRKSFCSGRKHRAIKLKGSLKLRRSLGDSRASGSRRKEPRLTCVPVACLSLSYSCTCSCCVCCSQRGGCKGLGSRPHRTGLEEIRSKHPACALPFLFPQERRFCRSHLVCVLLFLVKGLEN